MDVHCLSIVYGIERLAYFYLGDFNVCLLGVVAHHCITSKSSSTSCLCFTSKHVTFCGVARWLKYLVHASRTSSMLEMRRESITSSVPGKLLTTVYGLVCGKAYYHMGMHLQFPCRVWFLLAAFACRRA